MAAMVTLLSPHDIEPPHEVRDADKLASLVASMERDGWIGEPILLCRGEAWTGSHRIAAARAVGIDVPCYAWEPTERQWEILRYTVGDQDSRYCDLTTFSERGAESCDPEALRIYAAEVSK